MSEDARSGTLAAAVAPGYMQSAAAAPSEASNAGSWTGMTGCKTGTSAADTTVAGCADSFLRVSPTVLQFRKLHSASACFLVYTVARPGGFRGFHRFMVHGQLKGFRIHARVHSPHTPACQGGGWQKLADFLSRFHCQPAPKRQ